jgi:hypothetical protein
VTSNLKRQAIRGSTLRRTGPKNRSGTKRPKARRDVPKPTTEKKKKPVIVKSPSNGADAQSGQLKIYGGSDIDAFNHTVIDQVMRSVRIPQEKKDQYLDALLAAMIAFKPKDELEGMIAAQMVAIHSAVM